MQARSDVDFDVIQIGYGPVSKASALFLARLGWRVGIFERYREIYPLPRAVCVDHELFRVFHAAGLGAAIDRVTEPAPVYRWFNADWRELLAIDWTKGSVSGGNEVNFIHQPTFEAALDAEVKARPEIALQMKSEAVGLRDEGDRVVVTIRDVETGARRDWSARWVIGIDGANSFVRETLGIPREDRGFNADWLVIDFALNNGLTARDLGLPEAGQYCNPVRPTTIVPGGTDAQGRVNRRWEFMRLPHETREEMNEESKVWELLGDWIKPDQGELIRHTVYSFRSLIARDWRRGRVLLAGDAAHLMPPFMGQGMCAGLRDVWNLAWKLDLVLDGKADDCLLDSYAPERIPHVSDVVDASIFLGSIICIPDADKAAERDALFLSGKAPPPPPFPCLTQGFLAGDALGAGLLAPHGVVRHRGRTRRFDSVVPVGFTLVLDGRIAAAQMSPQAQAVVTALGVRVVTVADRRSARDDEIADTQGQILPWMAGHGMAAMLVRPDFYLFGGAADPAGLESLLGDLARQARGYGLLKDQPADTEAAV